MPPKKQKGQQPSKKTEEKKREKVIDDKTFGLKNKKGAATQRHVRGVRNQVNGAVKGGEQYQLNQKFQQEAAKKKANADKALLASLFKTVTNIKVPPGQDPKNIICSYFKQGLCQKGNKCKFSHEIEDVGPLKKPDLYTDKRDFVRTEIICKHFLDAVTKKTFGWGWKCPNGGDQCTYKHCLPPGFVLDEGEDVNLDDDYDEIPIEELIEEERAKLPPGGTKVTLETFMAWKAKKEAEAEAIQEEERKKEAKKSGGRGLGALTGLALFKYDPTIFMDDDSAMDEYEAEPEQEEETKLEEVKEEEEPIEIEKPPPEPNDEPSESAYVEPPEKPTMEEEVKEIEPTTAEEDSSKVEEVPQEVQPQIEEEKEIESTTKADTPEQKEVMEIQDPPLAPEENSNSAEQIEEAPVQEPAADSN